MDRAECGGASLKPGSWARCHGLRGNSALNGQLCRLIEYLQKERRWRAVCQGGEGRSFCLQHLRPLEPHEQIPAAEWLTCHPDNRTQELQRDVPAVACDAREQMAGLHVIINGMVRRQDLNGQSATLLRYDGAQRRWTALLHDGSQKAFKGSNLFASGWNRGESEMQSTNVESKTHVSQPTDGQPIHEIRQIAHLWQFGDDLFPGVWAKVCGIQARADFNGQVVQLLHFEEDCWLWSTAMEDGSTRMFRPLNLKALEPPSSPQELAEHDTVPHLTHAGQEATFGPGMLVRIVGISSRPDLNGMVGQLLDFDDIEQRWWIEMEDGSGRQVRESNLIGVESSEHQARQEEVPSVLQAEVSDLRGSRDVMSDSFSTCFRSENGNDGGFISGMRVRVRGTSDAELDDRYAKLFQFVPQTFRWRIVMDDGTGKRAEVSEEHLDRSERPRGVVTILPPYVH